MKFRVEPLSSLERTRVADHGHVWESVNKPHAKYPQKRLLKSLKTGHERWWNNNQLTEM